jgi:hypothetical protein
MRYKVLSGRLGQRHHPWVANLSQCYFPGKGSLSIIVGRRLTGVIDSMIR